MAVTHALWSAWDGRGLEHLRLDVAPNGIRADSLIVAMEDGRPFRARYTLDCDSRWRVRRARIEIIDEAVRMIDLCVDEGRWIDARTGTVLPLDECVDVDIYPSPFTNTLPIRRCASVEIGQPLVISVAWVSLPALTVHAAPQEYTLLDRTEGAATWRFRALDSDFVAELQVDAQGVVRDYPGIARRIL